MKENSHTHEKSLTATVILICVLFILFATAYFWISDLMEERCLQRMEEGTNTVIDEINQKLNRDSQILNTIAALLENTDIYDHDAMQKTMSDLSPLLTTMKVNILFPDNKVLSPSGAVTDVTNEISFQEEAALGEHVSDRVSSIRNSDTYMLRHYVPIVQNGETAALLYGITRLNELPGTLNINNIYNASASIYIIDTSTGDMILDTLHEELSDLDAFHVYKTKDGVGWDTAREELLALKKGHVTFRTQDSDDWFYFYYAPSDINKWAIAVSVPEDTAFANLFAVQRICYVVAAAAIVIMVIYYLWMRQNTRQILKLAVEQAVLEEKLHKAEAAEKAKTMFLSNMSHDIRTPMNAIIGFTTLAQTNIDNKEKIQEYLSKIMSSSNHLLSLINDILDMSRIESGRLNIEEKECNISDIFKDMRNILQTQMQSKQLNFFMDTLDVADEEIYCDKLHLNQVLLNLLSNAIKFTPSGGSVSLTIKQNPGAPSGYGAYEIRVKDTGIGMSPEFSKHVFEPFERERNTTVSGIQGTGLGMAITKHIIDTMGGTIRVETQQGKGTEYIINLEFRLQSNKKAPEVIQELVGLRSLVVDDSFSTCDSVTKMLTQIGMRVEWTLRGREAVLYARQAVEMHDEFHAYIIDWALPDLNGIEVARQIRAVVGESVPIIILTAYDWSIFEEEARAAGVTAFCNKPLFFSDLREALTSAIGKVETIATEAILPKPGEFLRGKRLLLVEDNELNREIAEEILTESGFAVETAEDGTVAVEKVKNSAPGYYDLILMDVQMPVMNGYEATKAIRALEDPRLASIPIVAMTANAFDEDRKQALKSGMDAHVSKPINVENLMEVQQKLLQ